MPSPVHCPTDAVLEAYQQGHLDGGTGATVGRHLETCVDCRGRAADLSAGGVPAELAGLTDYADIRPLGRGGMGVVYRARNVLMDRVEVLKVLHPSTLGWAGARDRFLREIQSAARLHHPNVVSAYAAVRCGDGLVFTMEYVDGQDLSRVVKSRGPLAVGVACGYVAQVAGGLQHAFEQGMIHWDIKPGNLILTRTGVVKILDFGLAKATREVDAGGGPVGAFGGPVGAGLTGC
ncbi:serine/threonine-protein kinase [Fimbriiglobus ruber]|uniref:Cellular communication/signal transduction protein n=1 Tax=Fimbriiglobus ruber TaxID=1908690 RepID=A0A225DE17_9BACT|nr:serine/threonine-protein kinase [Fimbriiglobus ruber]OWK39712.1 cellular communication/signal transduction protein [Fimbriiglobus ruber]